MILLALVTPVACWTVAYLLEYVRHYGGLAVQVPPGKPGAVLGGLCLLSALGMGFLGRRAWRGWLIALALGACAFAYGQWAIAVDGKGVLWRDALFDLAGDRDLTPSIRTLSVEAVTPRERLAVGLEDGEVLALEGATGLLAALDGQLRQRGLQPTLGVTPDSAAALDLERLIEAAGRKGLAGYVELFRFGKAAAAQVRAAAGKAGAEVGLADSEHAELLLVVADALMRSRAVQPTPEEERELEHGLARASGNRLAALTLAATTAQSGEVTGLEQLLTFLDAPAHRLRFQAAQYLLVLVATTAYPEGLNTVIPERDNPETWNRYVHAWRDWFARNRPNLHFYARAWHTDRVGLDVTTLARCAAEDLDCLDQLIARLDATSAKERQLVRGMLGRLVCPEHQPEVTAPQFALDESWAAFAAAWKEWFEENRARLTRSRCSELDRDGWVR